MSITTTLYLLVYKMEAIMLLEAEISSLRVLMESKLEKANWVKIRFKQLNLISEKRLDAICHHQLYHQRITKSYDKKSD